MPSTMGSWSTTAATTQIKQSGVKAQCQTHVANAPLPNRSSSSRSPLLCAKAPGTTAEELQCLAVWLPVLTAFCYGKAPASKGIRVLSRPASELNWILYGRFLARALGVGTDGTSSFTWNAMYPPILLFGVSERRRNVNWINERTRFSHFFLLFPHPN